MNVASVKLVSISTLKVKTTVVFVETPVAPLAGTDETRVGCACACHTANAPAKVSSAAKRLHRSDFCKGMI
jgi:hypothetical protein